MRRRDLILGAAALASAPAPVLAQRLRRPLIIAHRGASGERPEHTIAAYRLAIEQGADFIEPDLVMTKDGHLVCRHENEISDTTDVALRREFSRRRTTKQVDGVEKEGWFTEDFTLAELRTLGCKERLPHLRPTSAAFDGQEPIPTFEEVFALARSESARLRRTIGLYPEMKHPTHFQQIGLPIPDAMQRFLTANRLNRRNGPVIVQCFEEHALRSLRLQDVRARLVFLVANEGGPYDQIAAGRPRLYADYLAGDLNILHEFADGLGVEKTLIAPRDEAGRTLAPTDLVARAHEARFFVHAWTFRAENEFLPVELRRGDPAALDFARLHGDLAEEVRSFAAMGVDGIFTDYPARAIEAFVQA